VATQAPGIRRLLAGERNRLTGIASWVTLTQKMAGSARRIV
jgi:hypothetical protein